jgi:hypothetical protein
MLLLVGSEAVAVLTTATASFYLIRVTVSVRVSRSVLHL